MAPDAHRAVANRTLVSDREPAVEVDVAAGLVFVDRLRFILYDTARVDAFVFAADGASRTGQLLVVQFESYLESNDHTYAYSFAETVLLGERQFHADTAVVELVPPPPRESDTGRILDLLRRHGHSLADRVVVARFVHLPDAARRQELLVLYAEPIGDDAMDAALARSVRERALGSFAVRFTEPDGIG